MACPAAGLTMTEAVPTLIAAAAPYVGRETPKPVTLWAGDRFKPEVKVGEPMVVPETSPKRSAETAGPRPRK